MIFKLGGKDDMFQSKWDVFICIQKCGAHFPPNKHGMTAAHAHEVQTMKTFAIQSCFHLATILKIIVSSEKKKKHTPTVCLVLAHRVSSNFIFKDRVLKTRSLVLCIFLKTWEAKVHCQFLFSFLFWNYRGFQWGHCTAIWIIDFNWFNLVLKWAKTQALSLSEGSKRGAWSSTHL